MDCGKCHGTRYLFSATQPSLRACMETCAKILHCHSVDYSTKTKTCYYSDHHGEPAIIASGFQSAHSVGCSGACGSCTECEAEVDPQTEEEYCRKYNGEIVTVQNIDYKVHCGRTFTGPAQIHHLQSGTYTPQKNACKSAARTSIAMWRTISLELGNVGSFPRIMMGWFRPRCLLLSRR
jgi:hypothetical protein